MWSFFLIEDLYLIVIWQGLHFRMDTKKTCVKIIVECTQNVDNRHRFKFNSQHNWGALCGHLRRKGIFTFILTTFATQLQLWNLKMIKLECVDVVSENGRA